MNVRVEVFYNEQPIAMLSGFDPASAVLRKALDASFELDGSLEADCERVYGILGNNAQSSKPDGFADRTMSVGDLLRLHYPDGPAVAACAAIGFEPAQAGCDLDAVPAIDFPTWHQLKT